MIDHNGIMMIEPSGDASAEPVVDALTRKMAAAYRRSALPADSHRYRGWHTCRCGAESDNTDHFIDGVKTNSLCVHYLAFHRKDVPVIELAKVQRMSGEAEPSEEELQRPRGRGEPPPRPVVNAAVIVVNPLHHYFRQHHLEHVKQEMRRLGPPRIRAYFDGEIWHAQEGTHRLRSAKALGLPPIMIPVKWRRTQAALDRARYAAIRNGHVFSVVHVDGKT